MATWKVKVGASYKTATCRNMWQYINFETELPSEVANRLLSDKEGRKNLVRIHVPDATEISSDINYTILY